jgi:hypothetical protein
MMMKGNTITQVAGKVVDSLVAAETSGMWLYLCFYTDLEDQTKLRLDRIGWNFSPTHHPEVIRRVKETLDSVEAEATSGPPKVAELKEVEVPNQTVSLFGKED